MPSGVRMIAGRALPPDVLRNRLSQEQQAAIAKFIAQRGAIGHRRAGHLRRDHAGRRSRRSGARSSRGSRRCSASNCSRKRRRRSRASRSSRRRRACRCSSICCRCSTAWIRRIASACAPLRARSRPPSPPGDMLRYSLTRMLEKRLAKAAEAAAAGAAAGARRGGLRVVCGAGAMPLRRGQAGTERLSRGPHGHAAAAEVGAVPGSTRSRPRRSTPRWPASRRFIPPASARSRKAWRASSRWVDASPCRRSTCCAASACWSTARCRSFRSTWSSKKPTSAPQATQASAR